MYPQRIADYRSIEQDRNTKLLVFVTSDRSGMETQIAPEILPKFCEHLDKIGVVDKISLLLITNGGDIMTAWNLVNMIKSFCDNFEVIVPFNCYSAGTLLCLGANNIVMTKQATLGPIDPSTNGPLNPIVHGTIQRVPVSVESVNAFIEMARNEFQIHDQEEMTQIMLKLTEHIHPLVLGQVYRTRNQIRMIARKLLSEQNLGKDTEDKIVSFLCSESGSHDYAIHRREAREGLGLPVETPSVDFYNVIKRLYKDIVSEMELDNPFKPDVVLGADRHKDYACRRILIESVDNGTDVYITKGFMDKIAATPPKIGDTISNTLTEEMWHHEN